MPEPTVEILIVEDNPDDLELTLYALREHNVANRLHVARDGAEALDFLFAEGAFSGRDMTAQPVVILLDLKLPKVSGLEVLERVKADPRTATIPVVVLTSSREQPDIARAYELGANSYIVKPVDFEQFTDSIRELGLYWLVLNIPPNGA